MVLFAVVDNRTCSDMLYPGRNTEQQVQRGNQESEKTVTVQIDKTPPVVFRSARGCTIWPPNHKLVQVATVTASDSLSGLLPGSFTIAGTSNQPANGGIVITGGPNQFNIQLS